MWAFVLEGECGLKTDSENVYFLLISLYINIGRDAFLLSSWIVLNNLAQRSVLSFLSG